MKKIFTIILAACMLATSTFASPVSVGVESAGEPQYNILDNEKSDSALQAVPTTVTFRGTNVDQSQIGTLVFYNNFSVSSLSNTWFSDTTNEHFGLIHVNHPSGHTNRTSGYTITDDNGDKYATANHLSTADYDPGTPRFNPGHSANTFNPGKSSTYVGVLDIFLPNDTSITGIANQAYLTGTTGYNNEIGKASEYTNITANEKGKWVTFITNPVTISSVDELKKLVFNFTPKYAKTTEQVTYPMSYDNFAIYNIVSRTITFETNGKGTASQASLVVPETTVKIDISNITATSDSGYTFKGWSETQDGEIITNLSSYYTAADRTLYAVWEEPEQTGYFKTDFDYSQLGKMVFYENFSSFATNTSAANSTWNLGNVSPSFKDTAVMGAGFAVSQGSGIFKDGGKRLDALALNQWDLININNFFGVGGTTFPEGLYTLVFDAKLYEQGAESYNFTGSSNTWQVLPSYTVGQWITLSSSFTSDGSLSRVNLFEEFKYDSNDSTQTRTVDLDNYALFYLPNRTITLVTDTSKGTVNQSSLTVTGKYADFSVVSATPKPGYSFKGWSETEDGTVISDLAGYFTETDKTLYAVWDSKFTSNIDTSTFGTLEVYENFEDMTAGAGVNNNWALGKDEKTSNLFGLSGVNITFNSAVNGDSVVYDSQTGNTYMTANNSTYWRNFRVNFGSNPAPKGTYIAVVDVFVPNESTVTKFSAGKATDKRDVDVIKGEWYTVVSEPQTRDGVTMGELSFYYSTLEEDIISLDNFAVFYLPNRTVTFSNATGTNTLEIGQFVTTEQLASIAVPALEGKVFAGWSTTEEGELTDLTKHFFAENATVYPVYKSINDYQPVYKASQIRSDFNEVSSPMGMGLRVIAKIDQTIRADVDETEMGFIVTRETLLSAAKIEKADFTLDSNVTKVPGVSYKVNGDVEEINRLWINLDADDFDAFTAVMIGIPVNMYKDNLVFRSYMKFTVNGVDYVTYGEPQTVNVYDIAEAIYTSSEVSDDKTYAKSLIDAYNNAAL